MEKKQTILKTIYRIFGVVLLCAAIVSMLVYITYVTRDKKNAWMWDTFKALEKNSVTALFVGNSHSFCSINTDMLKEEYNFSSFMLSASGQTLAMDYYAIKEALKTQHPKTIYLEMSYVIHDWDTINSEMSHMFFDGMPFGKNKIEAVKALVPKEERIYFYLPLGQFHSRFFSLKEEDYASDIDSLTGRFYSDVISRNWDFDIEPKRETAPIPENAIKQLDKIVDLCKSEGIELILYTVPYSTMFNEDPYSAAGLSENQKIYNSLYDYAKENGLEYHNLFHEALLIGYDLDRDFMDSQHFNCYGQDVFTRYMVEKEYIKVYE